MAVQLAFVGRDYERAADHAVMIGRWVAFMVTGELPGERRALRTDVDSSNRLFRFGSRSRSCERELRSTSRSYAARVAQPRAAVPSPTPEEHPLNATLRRSRRAGCRRRRSRSCSPPAAAAAGRAVEQQTRSTDRARRSRSRSTRPLIAGFQGSNSDVTVNYAGGRLRARARPTCRPRTSTSRAPTACPSPRTSQHVPGRRPALLPDGRGADHGVVQPERRDNAEARRRRRWPRSSPVKIKKWNDAAIAADNPGVDLPSTAITVAHRADGSGTTSNFTKYLDDVDPTDWTLGSGDTVDWPSNTQAGTGNPGVAQIVQQNDGRGRLRRPRRRHCGEAANRGDQEQGRQVRRADRSRAAQPRSTTATLDADLTYDPINASGADGVPDHVADLDHRVPEPDRATTVGTNLKAFLNYIYGAGQGLAKDAGYAPLPPSYVQKGKDQVGKLQIPS